MRKTSRGNEGRGKRKREGWEWEQTVNIRLKVLPTRFTVETSDTGLFVEFASYGVFVVTEQAVKGCGEGLFAFGPHGLAGGLFTFSLSARMGLATMIE